MINQTNGKEQYPKETRADFPPPPSPTRWCGTMFVVLASTLYASKMMKYDKRTPLIVTTIISKNGGLKAMKPQAPQDI